VIDEFICRFESKRDDVLAGFKRQHPDSYMAIVRAVVEAISVDEYDRNSPDPERIHLIDDGDYQGSLVFVIAEKGYQPSEYWAVIVSYGSCSGCDTLQGISDYSSEPPTDDQARQYMQLAINVLQGLRSIGR
jgi:hypothetical protein